MKDHVAESTTPPGARTELDHGAVWNRRVFDDDDNAIANVETLVSTISLLNVIFVDNGHVGTNAGIFIKNGTFYGCALANPHRSATTPDTDDLSSTTPDDLLLIPSTAQSGLRLELLYRTW